MGYALSINAQLDFVTEECCVCHVIFAVTSAHHDRLRDKGESFHCPNGHSQKYTETTVQKLQRQLDAAKAETERQRQLRVDAERRVTAQIGVNTKLRKRIHSGVCPHCQRTFKQLAAHMKTQHPEECGGSAK